MNQRYSTSLNSNGGWMTFFWLAAILSCLPFALRAQSPSGITNETSRLYYAVENLETSQVVRRGTTTAAGFSANSLILAPETHYRVWLLRANDGHIGFQEFKTGQAGQRFTIPQIVLGFPIAPDSDGDGLSDDAEFVLGTDPANTDSNGDGIPDGAALKLGLDPGLLSQDRIVGSALTDGTAVDVCAVNDIAIVADSAAGVTVFNVFNRMAPIRIAQVDTPGNATAVTCSGNLVAVADAQAGLAVIDIADPPNARIVRQVNISDLGGGKARCVAAVSDLAFVGTDTGWLSMVELGSGIVLDQIDLGAAVEDLATEGDVLYAFSADRLNVIPLFLGPLKVYGSAPATGEKPSPRGRIFVGGGVAYLTFANGYMAFDVQNREAPGLLLDGRGQFFGWHQLVLDGSRYGLAPGGVATVGLFRYAITNATSPASYETTIETPGSPVAVALYNGLAYMAAGASGLHVVNYKAIDLGRQPPTGQLLVSVTNGFVTEGQRILLRADVRDDVQLRNVRFFVNGSPYLTDGNFPFEVGWRAPARGRGKTVTFSATATDTGGNETNLNSLTLTILPDLVSPYVTISGPGNGTEYVKDDDIRIIVRTFDENGVDPGTLTILVDGVPVVAVRTGAEQWIVRSSFPVGPHNLLVRAQDYAGNVGSSAPVTFTVVNEALSSELTVAIMDRSPESQEAISPELTVNVLDRSPESQEAISAELTVLVQGQGQNSPPPHNPAPGSKPSFLRVKGVQ